MEFSFKGNQTCKWIQGAGPVVLSEIQFYAEMMGFMTGDVEVSFLSNFLLNDSDRITELRNAGTENSLLFI